MRIAGSWRRRNGTRCSRRPTGAEKISVDSRSWSRPRAIPRCGSPHPHATELAGRRLLADVRPDLARGTRAETGWGGEHALVETSNTLVAIQHRQHLIATIGCENLIVITRRMRRWCGRADCRRGGPRNCSAMVAERFGGKYV